MSTEEMLIPYRVITNTLRGKANYYSVSYNKTYESVKDWYVFMMTTEKFHERLTGLMSERNLSVKELSELTGVAYTTLNNLIREKREPKMMTFLAIVDGLQLTVEEFEAGDRSVRKKRPIEYEIGNIASASTDRQAEIILAYAKGVLQSNKA